MWKERSRESLWISLRARGSPWALAPDSRPLFLREREKPLPIIGCWSVRRLSCLPIGYRKQEFAMSLVEPRSARPPSLTVFDRFLRFWRTHPKTVETGSTEPPHPEERAQRAWATGRVLVPTLRDGRCAASSG